MDQHQTNTDANFVKLIGAAFDVRTTSPSNKISGTISLGTAFGLHRPLHTLIASPPFGLESSSVDSSPRQISSAKSAPKEVPSVAKRGVTFFNP